MNRRAAGWVLATGWWLLGGAGAVQAEGWGVQLPGAVPLAPAAGWALALEPAVGSVAGGEAATEMFGSTGLSGSASGGLNYGFSQSPATGRVSVGLRWSGDAVRALSGREGQGGGDTFGLRPYASVAWQRANHQALLYVGGSLANSGGTLPLTPTGFGFNALDFGGGYGYVDARGGETTLLLGSTYTEVGVGNGVRTRIFGAGPQATYAFKVKQSQWRLNIRGYYEFADQRRPEGRAAFITLTMPFIDY